MNLKKIVIIFLLFYSGIYVDAETIEEKIATLNTKISDLYNQDDVSITIDSIYPVGSIYVSTNSTNPVTLFGGTWEIYSSEKKLVGVGSNGTTTYSYGATGGANTKTLTIANLPAHKHTLTTSGTISSTFTGSSATTSSSGAHTHTITWQLSSYELAGCGLSSTNIHKNKVMVSGGNTKTTSVSPKSSHTVTPKGTVTSTFTGKSVTSTGVGKGVALDIRNPYITVYMWKRIA